jgi:serine/threonine protein kinase
MQAIISVRCVQEFCTGGSLRQALQGDMFGGRLLQRWAPVCRLLEGIASGMDYMHGKRILHGDLNPNNILLNVCLLPSLPFLDKLSISRRMNDG